MTHGFFLAEDPHEQEVMRPYPPLGLLYCSAYLKQQGFEVDVFDATFASLAEFEQYVAQVKPPVVGIYCNMMTKAGVLKMVSISREAGCLVILGGPEPVNYIDEYLSHGAHVIVRGEGELTLEELLPHLRRRGLDGLETIRGIAYVGDDGRSVSTDARPQIADIGALPWPDRDAIAVNDYINAWRDRHGTGSVSLITARGCPYRCRWCSHAVFGYSHRRRDPVDVADEIQHIVDVYDPDMLWFADDVFTIHRRDFFGLAAELRRRRLKVPFETISREDRVNEEVARTLAEMGCFRLWLGAESGSQRILDAMERRTDVARVPDVVAMLQRHGIEVGMFVMLGYHGETRADLEATVEMLKRANPDVYLTTVAYPIKGTPYYDDVSGDISEPTPWPARTDRDLDIGGRQSRRYYGHATRWLRGEVESHRLKRASESALRQRIAARLQTMAGRLGMELTRQGK